MELFDASGEDLLNEVKKISGSLTSGNNVAILWDVENVTPDAKSLFVEGLMEYTSKFGRISISKAFADWTLRSVSKLIPQLSDKSFEFR